MKKHLGLFLIIPILSTCFSCGNTTSSSSYTPETDLERVFERFYRVDKSRSKEVGGTGLGLSIVKHIAIYHNGKVKATDRDGGGTRMIATLKK